MGAGALLVACGSTPQGSQVGAGPDGGQQASDAGLGPCGAEQCGTPVVPIDSGFDAGATDAAADVVVGCPNDECGTAPYPIDAGDGGDASEPDATGVDTDGGAGDAGEH